MSQLKKGYWPWKFLHLNWMFNHANFLLLNVVYPIHNLVSGAIFSAPNGWTPKQKFTRHASQKKYIDLAHRRLWLAVSTSGTCHIKTHHTQHPFTWVCQIWCQLIKLILGKNVKKVKIGIWLSVLGTWSSYYTAFLWVKTLSHDSVRSVPRESPSYLKCALLSNHLI